MPEIIECPRCQRKLRLDESVLGQDVICPACKLAFTAALPNKAAPLPKPVDNEPPIYRPMEEPRRRYDEPPPSRRPRYDDDPPPRRYDDDDDDYPRPRRRRYADNYLRPHRGAAVLTLGILGLMVFLGIPALIMAVVALIMGVSDLAAMNRGEMDDGGRGQTKAGVICAIIAIAIDALALFSCIGMGVLGNL